MSGELGIDRHEDTPELRKERGAFFTPPAIADFLAEWAVADDPHARVLDPTCGEAVFLLAASRRLRQLGATETDLREQVYGVDLHEDSLRFAHRVLREEGLDADLRPSDFFDLTAPTQLGCNLPQFDAVIGNPPFVRYQQHIGSARAKSRAAALQQGVRLSGLASSWAALVVHASAFLKPEGRLTMVLPAELLTVHYAEPVRAWLKERFASVHLVMFDKLQFQDATEKVVLLVAQGSGGCDSFGLRYLDDAEHLRRSHIFDSLHATPADDGKWTDLLLPNKQRQLFKRITAERFEPLGAYGNVSLGTVTGNNSYFTLNEATRSEYGLKEGEHVLRCCPPGTKHLKGLMFTLNRWQELRDAGEAVWMLCPLDDIDNPGLRRYIANGQAAGVHLAYKCQVRSTWWRPPAATPPDLFFTYMSHRYPRLIVNGANATFVNSMHGLRLHESRREARAALPLLMLNSVSMLGAEVHGRSYGGGILKMEPREAASLPVPGAVDLVRAWELLKPDRDRFDRQLRKGIWVETAKRVDEVLLRQVIGLEGREVRALHDGARLLRERRMGVSPEL